MNAYVAISSLRFLIALVLIAGETATAWGLGRQFLHLEGATAHFFALAVALPLSLGGFIAAAAHEPMHRPFALLLPGLRQLQCRLAGSGILLGALTSTALLFWANSAIAPLATLGLAIGLAAPACLDRHNRPQHSWGRLAAFLVWMVLIMGLGPKLPLAMNAAPWLFIVGGLTVGTFSLTYGFSRNSARVRAGNFFMSVPTSLFGAFSSAFQRRMTEEIAEQKRRAKTTHPVFGRDWRIRSVGPTSRDWLRVLWHEHFASHPHGSFLRTQLLFTGAALAYIVPIACLGEKETFWGSLANLTASYDQFSVVRLIQPGLAALIAIMLVQPKLAYPISRARLAQVAYRQAFLLWAAALIVPTTAAFLASFAGQAISERFQSGFGLPSLIATDLALAALLPLATAIGTFLNPRHRIFAAAPLGLVMLLTSITAPAWTHAILQPSVILCCLLATAGSLALLRHRLHRHYATCDLFSTPATIRSP